MADKLYLNIQEQVEKNKNDIRFILEEEGVLNQFGIKVIGQEDSAEDIPSVDDYKEDNEDWAYGDAYAIGTEAPYSLYVLTRANGTHPNDYWFNIGQFPKAGPQGETGEQGPAGHTPQVTATASVETLPAGSSAAVSVENMGTEDDPEFDFFFSIPKGDKGDTGATGEPGAFHLNGQVANSTLLPDASLVDADAAYAVGASTPYDIYVIMTVSGVQSWLNLGPVLTEISDTYDLGVASGVTSGTLSQQQLDALVNDGNMNFIKIGDILFVKETFDEDHNYFYYYNWSSSNDSLCKLSINAYDGSWSISSKVLVDITSSQTISGVKTFSNDLLFERLLPRNSTGNYLNWYAGKTAYRFNANIVPATDNTRNLGASDLTFKDGYFSGQVYAQNTFNVINASDISSNILTQDQYDLITNGKPILIKGTILNITDCFVLPGLVSGGYYYALLFGTSAGGISQIRQTQISTTTKEFALTSATTRNVNLQSINIFNGKEVPSYPASTGTFVLKCVDGVLTWVAE